jgi:hypothetical protein
MSKVTCASPETDYLHDDGGDDDDDVRKGEAEQGKAGCAAEMSACSPSQATRWTQLAH